MRAREGGFVAWFGAFVLKCFQQRRLLAANVASRAVKNLEAEVTQEPSRLTLTQCLVQRLALTSIFMAQIDDDLPRPHHEGSDRHALNDQFRQALENHAVFKSPWFALVGITDDVFHLARGIAHQLPLAAGGKAGPSHAAQPALLELCQYCRSIALLL